ncbi:MarR family winged helix-turn-helix transcriptional regulator [Actinoplanes flavus]|uniref:MarR family transcriptional regulator n=1 Tax=Actinoplanes flavus TaxID=2820290 RepID=A0ABS3UCX3_9ACTN|nr:MarR family transcriptional regulator [Actinoplanes flavus]MBO3736629.1 MarR family transcriptional regulator [Actinoplanes flavus]
MTTDRDTDANSPEAPADPATLRGITAMCRASNLVRRELERVVLSDVELTWSSYDVLHLSVSRRPIDTRTVAAISCLTKGAVSICANGLENRGLIRRGRHEEDHRRILLHPTAEGLRLIEDLRPRLITEAQRLLRHPPTGVSSEAVALIVHITKALSTAA